MYEIGWQIGGLVGFWIVSVLPLRESSSASVSPSESPADAHRFTQNYGIGQHIGPSHKQWFIPFAVQVRCPLSLSPLRSASFASLPLLLGQLLTYPHAPQLIPGGLFAIGLLFIKESPRWLITRNRRDEAIKNLCYIRKLEPNDQYIIEEINVSHLRPCTARTELKLTVPLSQAIDIQREHDSTAVGRGFFAPFKQVFTQRHLLRRLIIVTTLFMWQNGTGM